MTQEQPKTSNNQDLLKKTRQKQKKKNKKRKYHLSFLTFILIICVIQIGYSALANISKIVVYQTKLLQAKELKEKAELKNQSLRNELENFNSMNRVESIARNNLKMAGENEVLVIINTPKEEEKPKTKLQKFNEYFEKNIARRFFQNDSQNDFVLPQ